jgi:hypothetical protein
MYKCTLLFRCFGWLIESSPPEVSMIGATLEIQRAQQIEALEQQIIQQQIVQVTFEIKVEPPGYWPNSLSGQELKHSDEIP